MIADETREQRVRLTIELEDEENHLSALRGRAAAIGDKLADLVEWLRTKPETHIYRDGYSSHFNQNIGTIQPLSDTYVRALEVNPMLKVANEIRESLQRRNDLKRRLDSVGR